MNGSLLLLLYKRYANSTLVTMIDFKFYDQYVYTPNPSHMYLVFCEMYWYTKNGELYLKEKKQRNPEILKTTHFL